MPNCAREEEATNGITTMRCWYGVGSSTRVAGGRRGGESAGPGAQVARFFSAASALLGLLLTGPLSCMHWEYGEPPNRMQMR